MNNTLFISNPSNTVVSLFNRIRAGVWARITWKAHCHVPALIKELKDEEGEVRCLAAKILSRMGDEIEIPISTLNEALGDNEKYVYRFAIRTIEKKQIYINVDSILARLSKSTICKS